MTGAAGRGLWARELDAAIDVAREAGRVTLRWFQADLDVETKADRSPVTVADREAERVLRDLLGRRFPDDGIVGEEHGEAAGRSGRRWILDPIDGTRSFVHGVPLYGVMVALEADGEAVVGALHFPALGETVAAARGLGCRWNGQACRVSDTARIEDALVVTSGDAPHLRAISDHAFPAREAGLARIAERAGTFRTWGDCYGYALVATGRADVMLDPHLSIWDAAAVRPVIEEAGGVFTDWLGEPTHAAGHAVAANGLIARAVRNVLAGRDR